MTNRRRIELALCGLVVVCALGCGTGLFTSFPPVKVVSELSGGGGDDSLSSATTPNPEDVPVLKPGTAAPDITVTGMDGKKLKLSSLRGQVVLLDFWATWCPPCREGLPVTADFSHLPANKGLKVLAISADDEPAVKKFLSDQTYKLDAFIDPDQSAASAYKVDAIPATFIIDKDGKISSDFIGLQEKDVLVDALKKAGVDPS